MADRLMHGILLLLVTATALWMRSASLDRQSLWYDEAHWVKPMMESPSLAAWMQRSDDANRDMVPLYFVLEYFWCRYGPGTVEGMRWLSVLIGMGVVLMTYRFGRELFGSWAASLAGLCCALSPLQIYYAQELRPYGLMALLGLVSMYALYTALDRGGKGWWAIHLVANALLMWTHLFGLWLIGAQGIFLLARHRRPFRWILKWGFVNALPMVPLGILVLTWSNPGQPPLYAHWTEMASAWLCMDAFYLATFVFYRRLSAPSDLFAGLPPFSLLFFTICLILYSIITLGGAFAYLRRSRQQGNTALFLISWFAMPAALNVLFSLLIVPAFQLRYVIYSAPALYLMAGAGIAGVRRPGVRLMVAGSLIASMGIAGIAAAVWPMRSEGRAATRYIQANAKRNERILWHPAFSQVNFEANQDPALPRATAEPQAAIHDELMEIENAVENGSGVWVVHELWNADCAIPRAAILERYLAHRRIAFDKRVFLGRWDSVVYHCARTPEFRPFDTPEELARLQKVAAPGTSDLALRWNLCRALMKRGHYTLASALCRRELEAAPDDPVLAAAMERDLVRIGWNDSLETHGQHSEHYVGKWAWVWARALEMAGPDPAAVDEMARLHRRFPNNDGVYAAWRRVLECTATQSRMEESYRLDDRFHEAVFQEISGMPPIESGVEVRPHRIGDRSISCLAMAAPAALRFDLTIPPESSFRAFLGIVKTGIPVAFSAQAVMNDSTDEIVSECAEQADSWIEVSVPLHAYAHKRIALILRTDCEWPDQTALWGEPVISRTRDLPVRP